MGMEQRDVKLLIKYENDLTTTLNLACLILHLKERKLLTDNEADQLSKKELTHWEANKAFLSILKQKGRDALPLFIDALRSEKEHLGHKTLYEQLSIDYGLPTRTQLPTFSLDTRGNEANQLCSVDICQESGTRDDRPTALVTRNNSTSALDSGIAGQSTLSQKSSTGSEISSLFTTSSGHLQLASMEQQINSVKTMEGRILNEVTEMRKDIRELLPDIASYRLASQNSGCNSGNRSQRSSNSVKQGSARPSTTMPRPFKRSITLPTIASTIPNDDSTIHNRNRHISSPLPESFPTINHISIVDQLVTLTHISVPFNQPCLSPVVKEDQLHLLSCTYDHKVIKETVHSYTFASGQWKYRNIMITGYSNVQHRVFLLTYKEDLAVLRVTTTSSQLQFAKVGIYKVKESFSFIPFTDEVLKPFDLNNCQCVCSTRHIILASICQSSIVFYIHNYSSQWTSTSFSLPATCSYKLQSCTIIHSLELYCSLLCTGRNGLQTVEVHKVKLDKTEKRESIDIVYKYNASIFQCLLFTTGGRVMTMKVIANAKSTSSTLELCALNDASDHFLQKKKKYSFIAELSSVLPIRCPTYNNHVLIVYYDSMFRKWMTEIFSLE